MSGAAAATTTPRRCDLAAVASVRMTGKVLDAVRATIGARPAESGGVFGADADGVIRCYAFDDGADATGVSYSPNIARLNALLSKRWNPRGIAFAGFAHSHPPGCRAPSIGDRVYAKAILAALPHLEALFMPIVMSGDCGHACEVLPFVAERADGGDVAIRAAAIEIVEPSPPQQRARRAPHPILNDRAFVRVRDAYDLERLAYSRVICVGCGGAAAFIEDLARAGTGEFVLIDPDRVAIENIATQQAYRRDVGRAKVAAIADRIGDVNPHARVLARRARAETIGLETWREWARAPLGSHCVAPESVLLLGMTDSFPAQAFVNRIALLTGIPSLCAQLYAEGAAAELSFTVPGVTKACHRCMLASRWDAYANGYVNVAGTAGAPLAATARVNAIKLFLTLAILHHGADHPRWGGLLRRIGTRSLVQIRMDPDVGTKLGLRAFQRLFEAAGDAAFFDEAIWHGEDARPDCPDCGGAGCGRA